MKPFFFYFFFLLFLLFVLYINFIRFLHFLLFLIPFPSSSRLTFPRQLFDANRSTRGVGQVSSVKSPY